MPLVTQLRVLVPRLTKKELNPRLFDFRGEFVKVFLIRSLVQAGIKTNMALCAGGTGKTGEVNHTGFKTTT